MLGGLQVSRKDIDEINLDDSSSESDDEAPVDPRIMAASRMRPMSMPTHALSLAVPTTPVSHPLSARGLPTPNLLSRQISFMDTESRGPPTNPDMRVSFGNLPIPQIRSETLSPYPSDDEMESYCLVPQLCLSDSLPPPPPLHTPPSLNSEPLSPTSPHRTRRSSSIRSNSIFLHSSLNVVANRRRSFNIAPLNSRALLTRKVAMRRTSTTSMQRSVTHGSICVSPASPRSARSSISIPSTPSQLPPPLPRAQL